MRKFNNDLYQSSVALAFMLLSAFLLLFSFGNDGEAGLLTFFYLALILLLGIYQYVVVIRRTNEKTAFGETDNPVDENTGSYTRDDTEALHPGEDDIEDATPDFDLFVDELLKQVNGEEAPEFLMERFLSAAANKFEAVQGIVYIRDNGADTFSCATSYAFYSDKPPAPFEIGVTLTGQVAKNQEILNIDNVPDGYMTVLSGLGSSYPSHLLVVPFVHQGETVAVTELASFKPFNREAEQFFLKAGKVLSKEIKVLSGKKISA